MVLFYSLILARIFQIARLEYASIPEVGSSKNIIWASPTKAKASDNFLFEPPDSFPTSLWDSSSNSVVWRISSN